MPVRHSVRGAFAAPLEDGVLVFAALFATTLWGA